MSHRTDDPDRMPWMSDEDIRVLAWFTRLFPLGALTVVAVFYATTAYTPDWLPGQLDLNPPAATQPSHVTHMLCVALDGEHHICHRLPR